MEFEWDSNKADANLRKHRVSFEDATRDFLDPHRIETFDDRETYGGRSLEDRRPSRIRLTGRRLYRSRQRRQPHPVDFSKKGRCP